MKIVLVNLFEFQGISRQRRGKEVDASMDAPPIGLMTLAAILEQKGYEVELVDFADPIMKGDIPFDTNLARNAAEYVYARRGDVVGFTSRCDCYHYTLDLIRHYREVDPGTPTVIGGPQATITARPTMQNFPFIDYVVRHEGDRTFPNLLEAMKDGRGYDQVNGIVFRRNGEIIVTPQAELIKDLDEVPMPDYEFHPPKGDTVSIEVGRGCPFQCTFCSTSTFFARTFRLKSPERLVSEIRLLKERYNIRRLSFIHDMFTANARKVGAICEHLMRADLGVVWGCSARIDCVTPELLELMRAAGCEAIYFGIETGSPRMQKLLKKGLKLETVLPTLDVCNRLGIKTTTSFITGFPDETQDDVDQTLGKLLECACSGADSSQLHLFAPYPGTPLMEEVRDRLVFTGYVSDAAYSDAPSSPYYDDLIRSLPDLFCSYFLATPRYISLDTVQGIDKFGYSIHPFRHTIFCLLKAGAFGTIFDLWLKLREWLRVTGQSLPDRPKSDAEVEERVARFLETEFFASSENRFSVAYEAFKYDLALLRLLEQQDIRKPSLNGASLDAGNLASDAVPLLRNHTVVVGFRTDIRELERFVIRLQAPELSLSNDEQPYAIARRQNAKGDRMVRIIPLTRLMAAVLSRCESGSTVSQIVQDVVANEPAVRGRPFNYCEQTCGRIFRRLLKDRLIGLCATGSEPIPADLAPGVLIRVSEAAGTPAAA